MIRIGKIVAAHGLQGTVVMTHIAGNSKWLKKDDPLFLELNKGSYIPFFVTECKTVNAAEYTLSLEETDTAEDAKKLVGKAVYVKENVLAAYIADTPLLWIGFTMTDKNKGLLGTIDDVVQTGAQWLAVLHIGQKEVLVPLVKQVIVKISAGTKKIFVNLPEGLIEVYTDNEANH